MRPLNLFIHLFLEPLKNIAKTFNTISPNVSNFKQQQTSGPEDASQRASSKSSLSLIPIMQTSYNTDTSISKQLSIFNSSSSTDDHQIELTGTASQPVVSVIRFLWSKSDWLLGSLLFLAVFWVLFVFVTSVSKRKYNPQRKLQTLTRNNNTTGHDLGSGLGWRFSTTERQNSSYSANNSSNGTLINYGVPLSGSQQSTKLSNNNNNNSTMLSGNYYGNFNTTNNMPLIGAGVNNNNTCIGAAFNGGDYEHDMVQSCSQSLLTRTMQHHQQQIRNGNSNQMSGGAASVGGHYSTGGLTMASSNVPLINGTHNSRINLDYQQSRFIRPAYKKQQQHFGIVGSNSSTHIKGTNINYNEPIYDDVIYNNQMIL